LIDFGAGQPVAVSDGGLVAGNDDSFADLAFFWQAGVHTRLGTPPGLLYTRATDVNDQGKVVGNVADPNAGTQLGFVWDAVEARANGNPWTVLTPLGHSRSNPNSSVAFAINNAGVVVGGIMQTNDGGTATMWVNGVSSNLGWGDRTTALVINSQRGVDSQWGIAGVSDPSRTSSWHGMLNGVDLGPGYVRDVNDNRDILWANGLTLTTGQHFSELDSSSSSGQVNNAGEVVLYWDGAPFWKKHPKARKYESFAITDLVDPAALEELGLSQQNGLYLTAINNNSMIAGFGYDADGYSEAFLLVPIQFVEVTPKLKDEDGNEIDNSDKPKPVPEVNAMIEEPRQGQIPNIAYRVLKISVPDTFAGETIKWSMTPQFTPEGANQAIFRGQWPQEHPNRFEPGDGQENYYQFQAVSQQEGKTTIDADGETAVRINLPPIGFNKARVKLEFESYPGAYTEIDFEVPAVVVIDPGHGGTGRITDPDGGYSDGEHAVGPVSHIQEKTMALAYGFYLRDALKTVARDQHLNIKIFMTRETDVNFGPRFRTNKARDNGADILLSIHFNAFNATARGVETWIRRPTENVNYNEDAAYAQRIQTAVFNAIHGFDTNTNDRGIKDGGFAMTSDDAAHLGNTANYHPIRAALLETEFLDVPAVDQLLNIGPSAGDVQQSIVNGVRNAIIEDLRRQPTP
jgi:N-acetylmuramoyl-L-alanine amidase